jgi:hypothetical protein
VDASTFSPLCQSFEDKQHFLKYAGRYTRRPPIAEHRITVITDEAVAFWYKDKKLHRKIEVGCSKEEFVARWAQHILDHYTHSVRSFGLFAPRTISQDGQRDFCGFRTEAETPSEGPFVELVDKAHFQDGPAARQDRQ